jgi:hypothetical protein
MGIRKCRVCGCTDNDCRKCIEKTGEPCYWVEKDLCSACAGAPPMSRIIMRIKCLGKFDGKSRERVIVTK